MNKEMPDWASPKTFDEIRADMVEGAKMMGMPAHLAERLVAMQVFASERVTCLSCGTTRQRDQQCCGN